LKRRGAPGDPVSKLDVLRAQVALHNRRRPVDPTLADRCRYQAEHGPPAGPDWDDRRWPTADQLTDLAETIDEALADE
jgi:hypothetical protein